MTLVFRRQEWSQVSPELLPVSSRLISWAPGAQSPKESTCRMEMNDESLNLNPFILKDGLLSATISMKYPQVPYFSAIYVVRAVTKVDQNE